MEIIYTPKKGQYAGNVYRIKCEPFKFEADFNLENTPGQSPKIVGAIISGIEQVVSANNNTTVRVVTLGSKEEGYIFEHAMVNQEDIVRPKPRHPKQQKPERETIH